MQNIINKHIRFFFIFFLTFFSSSLFCHEESYPINPYVDKTVWKTVVPYFLPINNPIKPKLDKIFKERVTKNEKTLAKAGFTNITKRKYSNITVAKHPKIKGYLFKIYTDETDREDWSAWVKRIKGAKSIRKAIKKFKYENYFTVPQKWIYPLPSEPSPIKSNGSRKNFILIVQDMKILKKKANKAQWKNPAISNELLNAVYTIIKHEGLTDSLTPSNIPFDYNGKISFLDTEHHHHWPVPFGRLGLFLSKDKKKYWFEIIKKN